MANTYQTATRVDKNVFISGYLAAADPRFIRRAGITRIVKMFKDDPSYKGGMHRHPGVKYFVAAADDVPDYDMRQPVFAAVKFIQEGLKNGETILVHCHAGISRSSTVVLLHMMINRGYALDPALKRLQALRPQVLPNSGFMTMLRATDKLLKQKRATLGKRTTRREDLAEERKAEPSGAIESGVGLSEMFLNVGRRRDLNQPVALTEERPATGMNLGLVLNSTHAGERDYDMGPVYTGEEERAPTAWKFKG